MTLQYPYTIAPTVTPRYTLPDSEISSQQVSNDFAVNIPDMCNQVVLPVERLLALFLGAFI
jgi:hypothetical protein